MRLLRNFHKQNMRERVRNDTLDLRFPAHRKKFAQSPNKIGCLLRHNK